LPWTAFGHNVNAIYSSELIVNITHTQRWAASMRMFMALHRKMCGFYVSVCWAIQLVHWLSNGPAVTITQMLIGEHTRAGQQTNWTTHLGKVWSL